MSETSNIQNYTELAEILQKIEPNSHIAQIHGVICGMICGSDSEPTLWEAVFPNTQKSAQGEDLLKQIYEATYHELTEFSFEFSLLLPNDEADINVRAEALGLWCQGFLTGLELAKVSVTQTKEGELKEALDDIIEIAKINFGDIASNEEDETAYFELVEYVRLTVLMIFHELKKDDTEIPSNEDTSQH